MPRKAPDTERPGRYVADAQDAALVVAIARGDRGAYAALYDRYGSVLLGVLHRILGHPSEAEDVLQEVFLQVWRQAGRFDERRGNAFVWLTTLTRSRALDRLEGLASRQRTVVRASNVVGESVPDAAELVSSAEERRRLLVALADIPDAQRDVLLLAYFEGLTQTEIATRLDRPLGTIKSLARLGLHKLRERLGWRGR